jgi:hypothetical protein
LVGSLVGGSRATDFSAILLRADEASPTMTLLARWFLGVVHWRRRVPAPDCQTEPPRGAAMRR